MFVTSDTLRPLLLIKSLNQTESVFSSDINQEVRNYLFFAFVLQTSVSIVLSQWLGTNKPIWFCNIHWHNLKQKKTPNHLFLNATHGPCSCWCKTNPTDLENLSSATSFICCAQLGRKKKRRHKIKIKTTKLSQMVRRELVSSFQLVPWY